MLPNDVMSKIECAQLHGERFIRRRSTLQSHGLFALAKHLLFSSVITWGGLEWQYIINCHMVWFNCKFIVIVLSMLISSSSVGERLFTA